MRGWTCDARGNPEDNESSLGATTLGMGKPTVWQPKAHGVLSQTRGHRSVCLSHSHVDSRTFDLPRFCTLALCISVRSTTFYGIKASYAQLSLRGGVYRVRTHTRLAGAGSPSGWQLSKQASYNGC